MISQIVNFLSTNFTGSRKISRTTAIVSKAQNPFANPFVTEEKNSYASYAKNKPVSGGYYAGYYNGKPNIVGQRLFVEV